MPFVLKSAGTDIPPSDAVPYRSNHIGPRRHQNRRPTYPSHRALLTSALPRVLFSTLLFAPALLRCRSRDASRLNLPSVDLRQRPRRKRYRHPLQRTLWPSPGLRTDVHAQAPGRLQTLSYSPPPGRPQQYAAPAVGSRPLSPVAPQPGQPLAPSSLAVSSDARASG